MADKKTEQIVIGSLMKQPQLLSMADKYSLTVKDFDDRLMSFIFYAIAHIAAEGSTKIEVQDVDLFLQNSETGKELFKSRDGISLLNDSMELANTDSFGTYYSLLKKENLLRDLKDLGIDVSEYYQVNPITGEALQLNDRFMAMNIEEIIGTIKAKVADLEGQYAQGTASSTQSVAEGMRDLIDDLEENPEVGPPLQGEIFNTVVSGARRGTFYVRSGASGVSKTRSSVADACYLAFPVRYNPSKRLWENTGACEKVLVVITEQSFREVRTMILAYLTGFNEKKIKRKSLMTTAEEKILEYAVQVVEAYQDNMYIVQMPAPDIQTIKAIVRANVLKYDINYVFYDYIFISPSLLAEFKGFNLRNDEVLLMLSTALKDLAVELDVFVLTSTQVNASADDNREIRNEGSIAGSRAIINKADIGCVMARPSTEELKTLQPVIQNCGIEPNLVTDIYKNRGDEWTQVRIWSQFDMGNLRKRDLFITNSRLEAVEDFVIDRYLYNDETSGAIDLINRLNRVGKGR